MSAMLMVAVQCAPLEYTETSTETAYLPPTESPPEITWYEYTPTDTGYNYRYQCNCKIDAINM